MATQLLAVARAEKAGQAEQVGQAEKVGQAAVKAVDLVDAGQVKAVEIDLVDLIRNPS